MSKKKNPPVEIPAWFPTIGKKKGRRVLYQATMVAFNGSRQIFGDNGLMLEFSSFPEQFRNNIAAAAMYFLKHPVGTAADFHDNEWSPHLREEGWIFGPKHDVSKRTTPHLVPFSELDPRTRYFLQAFGESVKTMVALDVFGLTTKGDNDERDE